MSINRKLFQVITVSSFVFGCVASSTTAQTAPKQSAPSVDSTYVKEFTYAGNGCPSNSVASILSDDRRTLEIIFDKFQANLQKSGTSQFSPLANCVISLKLQVPAGLSASWHRVEHRGFADTSGNASGELRARYYIPGAGGFDAFRQYNFKPKYVRDYTVVHDNISTAYTQCGGTVPMTVNTRIRLYGNPTGFNALTVDSISKKVTTKLYFKYAPCKK